MFGIDSLTLRLEGSRTGKYISFQGEADEVPGMRLEDTLIPSEEEPPGEHVRIAAPSFSIGRLPKLPSRSR